MTPRLGFRRYSTSQIYQIDEDGSEQDSLLTGFRKIERSLGSRNDEYLTYFGFTRKQWLILLIFGFANIFATSIISIQAPFYPTEAESKGASATGKVS